MKTKTVDNGNNCECCNKRLAMYEYGLLWCGHYACNSCAYTSSTGDRLICVKCLEDVEMKTKPKKRNKQDATLININALKKRVTKLEKRVKDLEACANYLLKHTHC